MNNLFVAYIFLCSRYGEHKSMWAGLGNIVCRDKENIGVKR